MKRGCNWKNELGNFKMAGNRRVPRGTKISERPPSVIQTPGVPVVRAPHVQLSAFRVWGSVSSHPAHCTLYPSHFPHPAPYTLHPSHFQHPTAYSLQPTAYIRAPHLQLSAFRVWGSGFRVQGLGFGVQGSGFRGATRQRRQVCVAHTKPPPPPIRNRPPPCRSWGNRPPPM